MQCLILKKLITQDQNSVRKTLHYNNECNGAYHTTLMKKVFMVGMDTMRVPIRYM